MVSNWFKTVFFFLLLGWQFTFSLRVMAGETCSNNLKSEIEAIINREEFQRSRWGILIQTEEITLYSHNASQYFIPASNVKLLTTAAALHKLSPNFQITTSFTATGTVPNLTSLRVIGRGDPTITTDKLKEVAKQLKQLGVNHIEELIIEDGYFQEAAIHANWEWEDVYSYWGVAVNSLILNENAVTLTLFPQNPGEPLQFYWSDPLAASQWRIKNTTITAPEGTEYGVEIKGFLGDYHLEITGELAQDAQPDIWSLAVRNPAQYFANSFRLLLSLEGITINSTTITTNSSDKPGEEFTVVTSPTLEVLVKKTNEESNNLFAETLRHILGNETQEEKGVEAIKQSLTELGVNPDSYVLVDGSGLSRHNLVSPEALVQTLSLMAKTSVGKIYQESLPLAGETGTLHRRFLNTSVAGNLRAKTGTLTGVSALSGYLSLPNSPPIIFSIILNHSPESVKLQRQALDEIVLLLIELNKCLKNK